MKKFLFVLLVTLMAFSGFARDFSYEFAGQTLTYTVIDETQKTCRTKNGDQYTLMPGNIAEGDLIIPSQAIDGDKKYTVISIGDYSFGGCHALTSVTILNSVKSIGYGAFQSCTEMTSVTIPDSVTDIDDRAFSACVSLPSVTIPNSVTHIGNGAFAECWSLNSSLSIPNSVTYIGSEAFMGCGSLTSVTIGNSVTHIGNNAFCYCIKLTSVVIPKSVREIGNEVFGGCTRLISIEVDSANSNYSSKDGVLFSKDMTKLIAFPGGVGGEYSIPNSVTSIDNYAFYGCERLTSVSIPDSVTSLGEYAFSYCSGLTSVYYQTNEPIASYDNVFSDYTKPTLYVPAEAVEKCRTIAPWKNFSNIEAYNFSGEATGIDEVSAEVNSEVPYDVYSLNGVRLGNSTDNLVPGIYIICQGERINKIAVK